LPGDERRGGGKLFSVMVMKEALDSAQKSCGASATRCRKML